MSARDLQRERAHAANLARNAIAQEYAEALTNLGVPCAARQGWVVLLEPVGLVARLTPRPKVEYRVVDQRLPECIAQWPQCESGEYNPQCCRYPKSCSAGSSYMEAVLPQTPAAGATLPGDQIEADSKGGE